MGRHTLLAILTCSLALAAAVDTANTTPAEEPTENKPLQAGIFSGPMPPVGRAFRFAPSTPQSLNSPAADTLGNVYVTQTSGNVYSINGATGLLNWEFNNADGAALSSPIITSYGVILIGTTKGVLAVLITGRQAWKYTDGQTTYVPSTVIPDIQSSAQWPDAVFIAGRGTSQGGALVAVNGLSGATYWTAQTPGGTADALVGNGQVFVCYPGNLVIGGHVKAAAYSMNLGMQVWGVNLTQTPGVYQQFLFSLDSSNNVYVGYIGAGNSAVVSRLSPSTGAVAWTITTQLQDNSHGILGATNLFLASQTSVTAYSIANGAPIWRKDIGLSSLSKPIMAAPNQYLYMVSGGVSTVRLLALNATTGATAWEFDDPDSRGVFGMPVFDNAGKLYIESFSSTGGSTAYALNPATGAKLWGYRIDAGATIYYDTALALGNGVLYLGDDTQLIGVAHSEGSNNGGAVAAGVLVPIFLIGGIAGAVWWFKYKRPGTFPLSFSSFSFGAKAAAVPVPAAAAKGSYTYANL